MEKGYGVSKEKYRGKCIWTDIEYIFFSNNGNCTTTTTFLSRIEVGMDGGHVWRAEGSLIERVTGKRPGGRPRQRWYDTVQKDLNRNSE